MRTRTLVLLLWISSAALADDGGLLRCRGIADAVARLACYDALVLPTTPTQAVPGKPPAQSPVGPGTTSAQGEASPSKPPAVPVEQFGFEPQAFQAGTQAIESYIPGRFEGWDPNGKIQLANGQIWQVTDGSRRTFNLTDPKITIRRGLFGAFYMDVQGYVFAPKVKRVQ